MNSLFPGKGIPWNWLSPDLVCCYFVYRWSDISCRKELSRWGTMGLLPDTKTMQVAHAPGIPGTFSPPPISKKLLVSDTGMHHGTCVTYGPWWMSGSLTRGGGENVPGIPGACATRDFLYLLRGQYYRKNNAPTLNGRFTEGVYNDTAR